MATTHMMVEAFRLGQFDRALRFFERMDPESQNQPLVMELAANGYAQRGDHAREAELWGRLATRRPEDPRVARSYGAVLIAQGRFAEAVPLLQPLFERTPSDVELGTELAEALLGLRHFRAAVEVLEVVRPFTRQGARVPVLARLGEARYLDDRKAAAHAVLVEAEAEPSIDALGARALGRAWRRVRELRRAIGWFRKAVDADPEDVDSAEAIASSLEQLGDHDEARQAAHEVVRRFGTTPTIQRVHLRLLRQAKRYDDARVVGRALVEQPLSPAARRSVLLELAQVEQRAGFLDEAFAYAVQGNRLARTHFEAMGHALGTFTEGVARVLARADRPFPDAPARTSSRPAPIFLVGVPRSGTTLTQHMMQAHPTLVGLDETDPATRALRGFCRTRPELAALPYPERIDRLTPEDWPVLREAYWAEVAADGVDLAALDGGVRVVDKLPLSLVRLQWLSRLFPDAHCVVCLRDPRDVVWSNFLQDYEPNAFTTEATDLDQIAQLVAHVLKVWLAWREHPPLPSVELRYESLVDEPRRTLEPVFEAIGVPFDDAVLATQRRKSTKVISTPSYHDVTQPLYGSARGRWRRLTPRLQRVLPVLEEVATAFGYEPALEPA